MDFTNKLVLAPMAGVCDQPFRLLAKEQGCDILYTEMISAKGLYYNNNCRNVRTHESGTGNPGRYCHGL